MKSRPFQVGDGKVVHAKAQCNNGYSPANETVELVCTTKGNICWV